jgi:CO/xanthine dehydrogenase Mo-binding subunit
MNTPYPLQHSARLTRRVFLQATSGIVAVSILGVPGLRAQPAPDAPQTAGVATERIEGRAKVTGQKVYARDFNARDMAGWPAGQWYALYLHALTTDHAFLGIDLSSLPAAAQPTRVVMGDHLSDSQRAPKLRLQRDLHIDDLVVAAPGTAPRATAPTAQTGSFDKPPSIDYDLIVIPGNVPDYLGQAVALLMFDTLAAYRAARVFMQFRDAEFQSYASAETPSPGLGQPFSPQTTYVKYAEGGDHFSYASADPSTYMADVPQWQARIADTIAGNPQFIRQPIACDMRSMDPVFMEPEAGIVWHEAATQTLHIVLGTQSPDGDVGDILAMYEEDDAPFTLSNVVLTSCYPGGGFGGRDSSPFSLMLALAAAYSGDAPVRLEYDRFEQFRIGLKRHAAVITGQVVAAPDMTLQLVEAALTFDGGGLRNLSPYVAGLASLCVGGSYRCPMANIFGEAVHTENVSGGSQRGFGGTQAFFAIETALDEMAIGQGWDPVALRRANLLVQGDTTVVGGPVVQELRLAEMLDMAEAHPLWADRAQIKADYSARGLTYGTGLAMSLQAYGTSGDGVVAAVLLERDGSLTVQSDGVDMGNGSATTMGVVVGPILGSNARRVDMGCYTLFGQTGLTTSDPAGQRWANPDWTPKSVGSSSACLTALHQVHVMQQTAQGLFAGAILPAARDLWGMPALTAEETAWSNGLLVLAAGGMPPLSMQALADAIYARDLPRGALGHAYFQQFWAEADFPTAGGLAHLALDGLSFYLPDTATPVQVTRQNATGPGTESSRFSRTVWAPCINIIGLVADPASGAVQVENVVSILNAGKVHVPQLVSGQSQGGVAMAISYALLEDMPPGMAGPANGTWNLNIYHMARAQDVPMAPVYTPGGRAQELVILPESPGDNGAGRGIAEAVMCSIAPAISNALRDALGVRYSSLPITPQKIREGLGQ